MYEIKTRRRQRPCILGNPMTMTSSANIIKHTKIEAPVYIITALSEAHNRNAKLEADKVCKLHTTVKLLDFLDPSSRTNKALIQDVRIFPPPD